MADGGGRARAHQTDQLERILQDLCAGGPGEAKVRPHEPWELDLLYVLGAKALSPDFPPAQESVYEARDEWARRALCHIFGPVLTPLTQHAVLDRAHGLWELMSLATLDMEKGRGALWLESLRRACDDLAHLILADAWPHLAEGGRRRTVTRALGSPMRHVREWGMSMVPEAD